jgi:hypothetical protein
MSLRDHLHGRRRRSTTKTPFVKITLLALVLTSLLGTGAFLYIKSQTERVRTDATLCRTDQAPSSVTVLLLDMSEGFTEPQKLKITNELERIKKDIPRFGLIEAYAVDKLGERVTKPVVHLCNPGTGDDLNRLYQNPELARTRWKAFSQDLNQELERLMARAASPTSPIFEAVQATALRTFNRQEYEGVPKRLIVVSDLLQNVPGKLSQYEGTPTFSEFQHSPYFSEVRADLGGVTVTVLYLVRPRAPQKWPEHYKFWEQYFLAQGGEVDRVEPVYGAL